MADHSHNPPPLVPLLVVLGIVIALVAFFIWSAWGYAAVGARWGRRK